MSGEEEYARRRPMLIEYVLNDERKRLGGKGMTDDERKWRAQWIKDQELRPDEPDRIVRPDQVLNPNAQRFFDLFQNPVRRLYRAPWNGIQALIAPVVGDAWAKSIRYYTPKWLIIFSLIYGTHYYFKYHQNDWTRKGGWRVTKLGQKSWPGEPDFPRPSPREHPWDYADRGFKSRKVFLD